MSIIQHSEGEKRAENKVKNRLYTCGLDREKSEAIKKQKIISHNPSSTHINIIIIKEEEEDEGNDKGKALARCFHASAYRSNNAIILIDNLANEL